MAWRHGTVYGYDGKRCRCKACSDAKMGKRREYRDRARASRSPAYLNELAASRQLKEKYRGTCIDFGRPTSWGGGGCPPGPSKRCAACRKIYEATELRIWTQETVVAAIRSWAKVHGRPPTAADWRTAGDEHPPAVSVYRRGLFPSWGAAIEAAGFPRPHQGQRPGDMWWTADLVVEELRRLSSNGVAPSARVEINLASAARKFYGSWESACEAAGLTSRARAKSLVPA